MQTNLGKIQLTDKQIRNWKANGVWDRFHYIDGEVIAVSSQAPTKEQETELRNALLSIPDVEPVVEKEPTDKEKLEALWDFANGDYKKMNEVQVRIDARKG